jgi:hypothetical protein
MRYTDGTLSDLTIALNDAITELEAPISPADGTLVSATAQLNALLTWAGSDLPAADGTLVSAADTYNQFVGFNVSYWHGYFGIENLNLNASQRATLVNALEVLGPASDPQPARLNHWRVRLDDDAAIFEASFARTNLTIPQFKQWLGTIFGVDPGTIDHRHNLQHYAGGDTLIATFARSGTDYLRFALFGGITTTWNQSGDECRGYLAANISEWESEPV